MQEHCRHVHS
jgi:hypothetical protein